MKFYCPCGLFLFLAPRTAYLVGHCHYGFLELVHSLRLERLGEGLAVCSSEVVATYWVNEPVAEASASGSLGIAPESLVIAYGMEDAVHASTGEPYSVF
jgi:hypothetical protein